MNKTLIAFAAVIALLSGCAITKVDPPAPAAPPAQFKENALWQRATPATGTPVPDD